MKTTWWMLIAIFSFPFIIYSNTLSFDYALDDAMVISHNRFTQEGIGGLKDIFTQDSFTGFYKESKTILSGGRYRPFSIATFALENELWGNNPHMSHLINIFLYALTGLLLFSLLRLFRKDDDSNRSSISYLPFLATLLFLAHPVHSEVVANIKGRDEIFSLFFSLLAVFSAVKFSDSKKGYWLGVGFLALFLGLLSKENAIVYVLIIPLTLYFFRDEPIKKIIVGVIPSLAAVAIYYVIRNSVIGGFQINNAGSLMNDPFLHATFIQKYSTILFTLGLYLKLLFWPHPLTFDYYPYHIALVNPGNFWVIISLLIYLVLFVYALLKFISKHPVAYSILFFLIALFPVSNLVVNIGTFMNERFIYHSSVGFSIAIAWLLLFVFEKYFVKGIVSRYSAKLVVTLIILCTFSLLTYSRNFAWKNDYTLFLTDVRTSSNSAKSNCAAGEVLIKNALATNDSIKKKEDLRLAVEYLTKASKIDPTYADVWRLLGTANFELEGDVIKAYNCYFEAIKNNAYDENSYNYIHYIFSKYSNTDDKIARYNNLLKLNSRRPDIYTQLGFLFGRDKHDYPLAVSFFKKALNINQNYKEAYKGLGAVYISTGNFEESLPWLEKALHLDTLDAGTYKLLSKVALQTGDKLKADYYKTKADRPINR